MNIKKEIPDLRGLGLQQRVILMYMARNNRKIMKVHDLTTHEQDIWLTDEQGDNYYMKLKRSMVESLHNRFLFDYWECERVLGIIIGEWTLKKELRGEVLALEKNVAL